MKMEEVDRMLEHMRPAGDMRKEIPLPTDPVVSSEYPATSPFTKLSSVSGQQREKTVYLLQSMLTGRGRLLQGEYQSYFHGSYSGAAFICSVLEFFNNTDAGAIHPHIMGLFDAPDHLLAETGLDLDLASLPAKSVASALVGDFLAQSHPFLQFLNGAMTWQVFHACYDPAQTHLIPHAIAFVHAVLALAFLTSARAHTEKGCEAACVNAAAHFSRARVLLGTNPSDMIGLQACLCMAVYLLRTSRVSEAYTCMAVATTSAIKQGLHVTAEVNTISSRTVNSSQKQVLTTLVNIDLYISTILGLPPLINIDTAGTALNGHRGNATSMIAAQSFFGEKVGRQNLQSAAPDFASRCCQIISLTASVIWDYSTPTDLQELGVSPTAGIDSKILEQAEKDLALWTNSVGIAVSPSMADTNDVSATVTVAHRHLELAFYWSQLLIYLPFLHYLRPLAGGQPLHETLSRPALTCLKIAVNTIVRCDSLLAIVLKPDAPDAYIQMMHSSNWSLIYTCFLAVVMLIFLISLHEGTSKPSQAWQKAQMGIRVLMALRCNEGGATRCLVIVQELVRQLNYTVDFDFQEIEAATTTVCQRHKQLAASTSQHSSTTISNSVIDDSLLNVTEANQKDTISNASGSAITPDELLERARAMPLLNGHEMLDHIQIHNNF